MKFTPDERLLAEVMDFLGDLDDPCNCDLETDDRGRTVGTVCVSCRAGELFARVASRLGYTWVNPTPPSDNPISPGRTRPAGGPPR